MSETQLKRWLIHAFPPQRIRLSKPLSFCSRCWFIMSSFTVALYLYDYELHLAHFYYFLAHWVSCFIGDSSLFIVKCSEYGWYKSVRWKNLVLLCTAGAIERCPNTFLQIPCCYWSWTLIVYVVLPSNEKPQSIIKRRI